MTDRVAIIGMACRYPDAASPAELWTNVLARRRAFRRLPDERTPLADYHSPDPAAEDRFYARNAAVIEGYEFDRVRFRIAGSTYRSTDLTHWLALDMAAQALADAGFPAGAGLPREDTAVIIGNTLTGEFTRANVMRLRWPYVRRVLASSGLSTEALEAVERAYKAPFPAVDADTLAGGLANTIAGRICNYFDLGGGGYTVDGACSSSLLSVAHACRALTGGDADVAIAGGVDLSIDPFELVGFAKTGALAATEMRVYDRASAGFWPGEGCGMLVLAREEDARAQGRRIYAVIAGWGMSSDGSGGITRPEVSGQRRALTRAYARAGFGPETVGYFEGHGTGTAVGDATEIAALSAVRAGAVPAVLGTVKANIGHTKAAAGVAGVIKAAMAVHSQVIPPTTGCVDPHPALAGAPVRVTSVPESWPVGSPVRAGVSSMGFGGINTHVVLESAGGARQATHAAAVALARTAQDVELLLFDADTPDALVSKVSAAAGFVARLSYANLADLAVRLSGELAGRPVRAAVVAGSPAEAASRLERLGELVSAGAGQVVEGNIFYGRVRRAPRIVFAFPGQGSNRGGDGALRNRFSEVADFFAGLPTGDPVDTAVAQPRIAAGSATALRLLTRLGITASSAVGHSLGELTALHWAGAMDAPTLIRLATRRGHLMATTSEGTGAMASIAASPEEVRQLLAATPNALKDPFGTLSVPEGPFRASGAADGGGPGAGAPGGPGGGSPAAGQDSAEVAVDHRHPDGRVGSPHPIPGGRPEAILQPGADEAPGQRGVWTTFSGESERVGLSFGGESRPGLTEPWGGLGPGGDDVVIAGFNAPRQTVVAGAVDAVADVVRRAERDGLRATRLPVSHAFHSPQVAPAALGFADALAGEVLRAPRRMVVSTVTGEPVPAGADLAGLLVRQVTAPVRFAQAVVSATEDADLVVEVGPGQVLSGLVRDTVPVPVVATDSDSASLAGVLRVVGAAFALGAPVRHSVLFGGRFVKELPDTLRFFANPCEVGVAPVEVSTVEYEPVGSLELVRRLAAERAELPVEAVGADSGLLDELHLSSITVGQVVADAVRAKGLPPAAAPVNLATATVRQIADVLDQLGSGGPAAPSVVDGVAPWVRAFSVAQVVTPRTVGNRSGDGVWRVFASEGHSLAGKIRDALQRGGVGDGVLVVDPDPALALAAAKVARGRFVLVHHGGCAGAVGLVKSFFLENPAVGTLVVEVPLIDDAVAWVVDEVAATSGFAEVRYDSAGVRSQPVLRPVTTSVGGPVLRDTDVLLVTGGGKGITAECALAMAAGTGATVALLGRSSVDEPELAANLERFRDAGVSFRYLRVDVTDAVAVREAVGSVGPVTAVLHGAGRNVPRRLAELDDRELSDTFAPKVDGLRAVLEAVDTDRLRLLVSFGSIIGRAGLAGEAHYAAANAALTELTERFGREHPHCRCLTLEWSVWSGAGMGERLGVVDSLRSNGITPITTADGLALLKDVLATTDAPTTLVVTGRVSGLPTVTVERRDVPPLRFTDRVLVDYPGVELVAEAVLSTSDDRYLEDHVLEGNLMFPAVLGMEAMSQVACAVTGRDELPALERVELSRPIVVPRQGTTTIRVAALVRGPDTVDVVVRSEESGFAAEHFRATCRFPRSAPAGEPAPPALPRLPLDPGVDLYGVNLFQGRRFQRLLGYRQLGAARCVAEVAAGSDVDWFGRFLPGGLLLGDPGVRDAFMQAIQGARPDQTLLPVGVDRVLPGVLGGAALVVSGVERHRERDEVVWDLTARDTDGSVVERWEGLRLRVVRTSDKPLPAALLGPYLERHLDELFGGAAPEVTVAADASAMAVTGEFSCSVGTDRLRCAAELATEPVTLLASGPPGWVVYAAGEARIATYATTPRGAAGEVVLAVKGK